MNITLNFLARGGIALLLVGSAASLTACSKAASSVEGDGDTGGGTSPTVTLPTAGNEPGAYTLNSSGGIGGGGGVGGVGGSINISLTNGGDGRLEVLKHGKANAAFTPVNRQPNLGSNPYFANASIQINIPTAKPAAGLPYLIKGDIHLYLATSSTKFPDPAEIVTGMQINSGVTVTLRLNDSTGRIAQLVFTNDVANNGALVTADTDVAPIQRGFLNLWVNNYIGTGAITTKGTNTSPSSVSGGMVTLTADSNVYNAGAIETSGYQSSTDTGGHAGDIQIEAKGSLENTGVITSSGGITTNPASAGGNGGSVSLYAGYGHAYNSGTVSAVGGNGMINGGVGGAVYLRTLSYGGVRNSGSVNTNGGNGTAGAGGFGGSISIYALGGDLVNSANLTSDGGAAPDGSNGGKGGNIYLRTAWGDFESVPGNIIVSGNLSTRGGSSTGTGAGNGGSGGGIFIQANSNIGTHNGDIRTQLVGLWGYTALSAVGGTGKSGGTGGTASIKGISGDSNIYATNWGWVTAGDVINESDVSTAGGNSTNFGGTGGSITISLTPYGNGVNDPSIVHNSGNLTTTAGTNVDSLVTKTSGSVTLSAPGGVTNGGAIHAQGSDDAGTNTASGQGNNAGAVALRSLAGKVTNTAAIVAHGGTAQDYGGDGNSVELSGITVSNSGAITTNGGNALATGPGIGLAGDAGDIKLIAKKAGGIANSGTLSYEGGAGSTTGNKGHLVQLTAE